MPKLEEKCYAFVGVLFVLMLPMRYCAEKRLGERIRKFICREPSLLASGADTGGKKRMEEKRTEQELKDYARRQPA
jgi:hypothetical protein